MRLTALGIVATVVSLIDSLGGAVCKFSNKRSSILLWKRHDVVVLIDSENGTKKANAKDFDIPTTTLNPVPKNTE